MLLAIKEKIQGLLISFSLKKRSKYFGALFIVLAAVTFFAPGVHAQVLSTAAGWLGDAMSWVLLVLSTLCLKLTLFIVSFMIEIAGYNGYLDLDAINTAWVLVRDFANMGFIIVLLVIAFGTILGLESYEWKKMLPKLVFAAVIVNFSRVICGALIDISQILMNTFLNGIAATAGGNIITMFNLTQIKDLATGVSPDQLTQTGATLTASLAAFVFSALIMVILGVFLILLVKRVVYLWVLIVISPLAFVLNVLPQTESFSKKWWNKFNDHLITGPVLLFFMWLSLIIFGGGNISVHLADNSYIDDSLKIRNGSSLEADKIGSQNAGIGKALAWDQMVNMILAIAFLFIGAAIATEIGESGAGLLGRLTEVAEFAAGVWIGRKILGKAKDAGSATVGWAANKIPFVGGDAWRRRWSFAGAAVSNQWGKVKKARNDLAISVEDAKTPRPWYSLSGAVRGVIASALQTDERADKKLKDMKAAAENRQKEVEESLSTSDSYSGEQKRITAARARRAEKYSEVKKKQKEAMMDMAQLGKGPDGAKYSSDDQIKLAEKIAAAEVGAKALEKEKDSTESELEAALHHGHGLDAKAAGDYVRSSEKLAAEEVRNRELHKEHELSQAMDKVKALRDAGQNLKAANLIKSTYQHFNEEDEKALSVMDQGERESLARQVGVNLGGDPSNIKDRVRLLKLAAQNNAEEFKTVITGLLRPLYKDAAGNDIDIQITDDNRGQLLLEASMGRRIQNVAEFRDAQARLDTDVYGTKDESQAVQSSLRDALNSMGSKGQVGWVSGVAKEDNLGRAITGNPVEYGYVMPTAFSGTGAGVNRKMEDQVGTQDWFANGKVDTRSMINLEGAVNTKIDRTDRDKTKITAVTPEQRRRLVNIFGRFGDPRDVASGFDRKFSGSVNDVAQYQGTSLRDMAEMFRDLDAKYTADNKSDVYDEIVENQFGPLYRELETRYPGIVRRVF